MSNTKISKLCVAATIDLKKKNGNSLICICGFEGIKDMLHVYRISRVFGIYKVFKNV